MKPGGHGVAGKAVCDGGLMIAYFHRDLQYGLIILSGWTDPVDNERNIAWTRELFAILGAALGARRVCQ